MEGRYLLIADITATPTDGNSLVHLREVISISVFEPSNTSNILTESPSVNCYPNPVTGLLRVEYDLVDFEPGELSVFDVAGRMVMSQSLSTPKPTLDVNALPPGNYTLRATIGKRVYVNRIVKG